MKEKFNQVRFPILAIGVIILLTALWAGLLRLGWKWPSPRPRFYLAHGPMMVSGFLGTLIGVERAVALQRRWVYLGPLLSGIGGVIVAVDQTLLAGPALITLGSLVMLFVFVVILRQHPVNYYVVMALGALLWLLGNGLWLFGMPIHHAVYWWIGFLVLTIAGERLELGKLVDLSPQSRRVFVFFVGLFVFGLGLSLLILNFGVGVAGGALIGLSVWLLKYDIARKTIRGTGLPRFVAACLLVGFVWLGIGGLMWILFGGVIQGFPYDIILHSVLLGFVGSMIFAHAPIILPAILMREIRFEPGLYLPLGILHLGLVLRLSGDFVTILDLRLWGGLLNVIAILIYFLLMLRVIRRSRPI
jgi:hypothetical protein